MLKTASIGSISHGTLKTNDLLSAFISEMESLMLVNGDFFSKPENFSSRDLLNNLIGEAQDCFGDDGEIKEDSEDLAEQLVNEDFPDKFGEYFAPSFCYFGTHPGDGSDFGFWPIDIEEIKEQVEFVSSESQEWPDDDFKGEFLHINERGNCTLYVRENGKDREIWSLV
jgi:hypothetical protein